jgi:hypothetical protein
MAILTNLTKVAASTDNGLDRTTSMHKLVLEEHTCAIEKVRYDAGSEMAQYQNKQAMATDAMKKAF